MTVTALDGSKVIAHKKEVVENGKFKRREYCADIVPSPTDPMYDHKQYVCYYSGTKDSKENQPGLEINKKNNFNKNTYCLIL